MRGHGLTLQLLGQYLRLVEGGDILKRDTVRLAEADREYQNDATRPYGHAFKAMEAYEKWFLREGEKGQRQLAVLRLLGLFDRPASKDCLDALRREPVIAGLTEPLVGLAPREWTLVASRLEEINLLTVQVDGSVDAHPLLREYFGQRVRQQQPETWRAAHRRLYEHLCATTKEGDQPKLEDLQPLYQAVAHDCQAGMLGHRRARAMPLFLADIHLHRARLFHAVKPYPWESPRKDLAEARRLIEKHGYWRRKGELEDAEAAASNY